MIAFAKRLFRPNPRPIRLSCPGTFILYRGATEEKIDADFDPATGRLLRLVVHTRQT